MASLLGDITQQAPKRATLLGGVPDQRQRLLSPQAEGPVSGDIEADRFYQRNKDYALPARSYLQQLQPDQEAQFQQWVKQNGVQFSSSPQADYDMRGFWADLVGGGGKANRDFKRPDGSFSFNDYFLTPYAELFSDQSKWAAPNAPSWNEQDQLVDRKGNILFDGRKDYGQ